MRLRLAEDDFLFSRRNLHGFAATVHVRKRDQEAMVLDRILRVCVPWIRAYAALRDDRKLLVVDAPVETVASTYPGC